MMINFGQCRPESRGEIALRSPDPADRPVIRANYLDAPQYRRMMVDAARLTRRVARAAPLAGLVEEELWPPPEPHGGRGRAARLHPPHRHHGVPPCGTCRIGTDAAAVVDPALRLRGGVRGLRVADASVMPLVPSSNIQPAVMMIAERAADLIRRADAALGGAERRRGRPNRRPRFRLRMKGGRSGRPHRRGGVPPWPPRSSAAATWAPPFASLPLLGAAAAPARAQGNWPSRPVTLIVPYAAGGSTDAVARILAQRLSTDLGQNVVVDNRSGATGTIGMALVARARPDGHTLALAPGSTFAMAPHLYKLPYDNESAFAGAGLVATMPIFLTVPGASPPATSRASWSWRGAKAPTSPTATPGRAPRCTSRRSSSCRWPGSSCRP